MGNEEFVPGLEALIKDFLKAHGIELVELDCRHEGGNLVLRLIVDKPEGGITVGECITVNRRLGTMLEEIDFIKEAYILEVNSPGLDRPLKTRADFLRCKGRAVKFFLIEPINGKIEIDATISGASEEGVETTTPQGVCFIPFSKLNKAKQIY
jgi:ribosome maturation factor RimP